MKLWKRAAAMVLALTLCTALVPAGAVGTDVRSTTADGGMSHSIALKDGTVYTWGSNQQMQLGFAGTEQGRKAPAKLEGLSGITAVAAGYDFSAALSFDGTVYTWGGGLQSEPTQVPGLSGIVDISAGQIGLLALDQNGHVWQWSLGEAPVQVPGLNDIAAVSAGGGHYLALTFYGDVYAWGSNQSGQLGIGSTEDSAVPRKLNLLNMVDVAAGHSHSLAVAYDGTVYAWGANTYGQLGSEKVDSASEPIQVKNIKNAVQVSAGNDVSMVRTSDGKIYTWGYGEYGQLGTSQGGTSQSTPKLLASADKPAMIASGVYHNMYVSESGSLYLWGRNRDYQLGNQRNTNANTPQRISNQVELGEQHQTSGLSSASAWAVPELQALRDTGLVPPVLWQDYQGNLTRAEFAHMLVNLYEQVRHSSLLSSDRTKFEDIKGHVFQQEILKAYNLGLISGTTETTFEPDGILTRQAAAKMLCTFLTKMNSITISEKVTSMTYYTDASEIADWAAPYVAYVYKENIMQGVGSEFAPNTALTGEQGLLLVARLIERYGWS